MARGFKRVCGLPAWALSPVSRESRMTYNIPIYAAGRDHPYKEPCARIIRAIAVNPARFLTDAEVLQELMHHYLRTNRWVAGREVFHRFETLLRGRIEPTYPDDICRAARMAD